ncbi:YhzF [Bacillus subtilis QB928]|nr:YhzF [Bacillus subtilis QB928]
MKRREKVVCLFDCIILHHPCLRFRRCLLYQTSQPGCFLSAQEGYPAESACLFNRNRLYTMSYLFHKTPRLKHADMLRALCSKKPLPEAEEVLCDNYLAASIKLERLKMVCTIG